MSDDAAQRSEAARALGRARTPRKARASRDNLEAGRQNRWADPEARKAFGQQMIEARRRKREAQPHDSPDA